MKSYLGHGFIALTMGFVAVGIFAAVTYAIGPQDGSQLWVVMVAFGALIVALIFGAIGTMLWVDSGERRAVRLLETLDQRPAPLIPKRTPEPLDEAHSARKE